MLAPASRAALDEFAPSQGVSVDFRRRSFKPWDRALLKVARRAGAGGVAARVEQRKLRLGMMEPVFGSLVLRWALSVVRGRYEAAAGRGRGA